MPTGSPGISGVALTLGAAGGVMVISGLKNATIADTVRALAKGQPIPSGPSAVASVARKGTKVDQPPADPGAPPTELGAQIVAAARREIGKPYAWATAGPDRFDCSGLVTYVLKGLGLLDRRLVTGQFYVWSGAVTVPRPPRAGDLICWTSHIGIATSATHMIHAPTFGQTVQEAPIWWTPAPIVRRVKGA